jgi:hypothetical protein
MRIPAGRLQPHGLRQPPREKGFDRPQASGKRNIHDKGLVAVLKQLHEDLDTAVFAAYGWPAAITDQEILEQLTALNSERAGGGGPKNRPSRSILPRHHR